MASPLTSSPETRSNSSRAAIAAVLVLCLGCLATGHAARTSRSRSTASKKQAARKQKIQALRQRLKTLKAKRAVKVQQLRQTKRTQRRLSDQLREIYERQEAANEALQQSENRLKLAEFAVQQSTRRLREAEERLLRQQRQLGKRIRASYVEGPVSYADVLFGARNMGDFLDRQYIVTRVMSQDAEILEELRAAQQAVLRERKRLVERRATLAAAHAENAERLALVQVQAEEQQKLLREIQRERALQEQRLEELQEDSQEIQNSLEQELARRLANPAGYRNLPAWSGNMAKPAHGPVTSGFGYRFHPVLKYRRLHSGVDIGAPTGSGVYAAADGEVFSASWRGGYGRCIIVLHGGGVSTLYGHLSRIAVSPGQSVRRGQLIGAVGSTGLSTGPHLHFEVRRNGVPVNPF